MAIYTELLACKWISDKAREALKRACCPIHEKVLWGDFEDVEIVELHHGGYREGDINMLSVWGVPREIQIRSLDLYLFYRWDEVKNGWGIEMYEEEYNVWVGNADDEPLGDLDEHPF